MHYCSEFARVPGVCLPAVFQFLRRNAHCGSLAGGPVVGVKFLETIFDDCRYRGQCLPAEGIGVAFGVETQKRIARVGVQFVVVHEFFASSQMASISSNVISLRDLPASCAFFSR